MNNLQKQPKATIKKCNLKGFTLVEMLIAMAITAMVAMMAFQSFDAASRNADKTRKILNSVNKLDKAWQIIGQDMRNLVVQPIGPQATPTTQLPFMAASQTSKGTNSLQVIMQFARRGWFNPLERLRSDLQQVNYRVADGKLYRDFMPERNLPPESVDFERQSMHQLLLEKVSDIQVRFLSQERIKVTGKSVLEGSDYSNSWEPTWPPLNPGGPVSPPMAVEITIEVAEVGRSVRLFELPQQ